VFSSDTRHRVLAPGWLAVLSLGLFIQIAGILLIADGSSYSFARISGCGNNPSFLP
jgi:putative inorganic carbon (HCO3(-)) transporter